MNQLTPETIVRELDRYIIGQNKAKRAVAIALRNRWRRQKVEGTLREEIMPNNILMIGPTGVGKTEIARRLANLAKAPFVKVEASKFTEVGYVGRDVESMVRDLMDLSVSMVKQEKSKQMMPKALEIVKGRLLDCLLPPKPRRKKQGGEYYSPGLVEQEERWRNNRHKIKRQLESGQIEHRIIEIDTTEEFFPVMEVIAPGAGDALGVNLQEVFSGLFPSKKKRRKTTVAEARNIFLQEEINRMLDMDQIISVAKKRVENSGIIFIDEIDKIVGGGTTSGPDVSREGVQRDLLPLIEGCNVMTKYGIVRTDHILFITAGAFSTCKPSDLVPELQGRLPIRVELDSLTEKDFRRILTEPENALVKQYQALISTEGAKLRFTPGAIKEIAHFAALANSQMEDTGARRLHTVLSALLEDIMFYADKYKNKEIIIRKPMVRKKLSSIISDENLSKYIL